MPATTTMTMLRTVRHHLLLVVPLRICHFVLVFFCITPTIKRVACLCLLVSKHLIHAQQMDDHIKQLRPQRNFDLHWLLLCAIL